MTDILVHDGALSWHNLHDLYERPDGDEPCVAVDPADVFAFGCGGAGRLGHDSHHDCVVPTCVRGLRGKTIRSLACGETNTLVATAGGRVYVSGSHILLDPSEGDAQDAQDAGTPTPLVSLAKYRIRTVACGSHHAAALEDNGVVWTWGRSTCGQLGLGEGSGSGSTPARVLIPNSTPVLALACGREHTMAMSAEAIYAWGNNASGQLGLGDLSHRDTPTVVFALEGRCGWQIACGASHSAAILDETVYVWGSAVSCGILSTEDKCQRTPLQVKSLKNARVRSIACGGLVTGAVGADTVFTWGENVPCDTPVRHQLPKARHISCGFSHFSVTTASGELYMWGSNDLGQLGNGNYKDVTRPIRVKSLENRFVTNVCCGQAHTIAVTEHGLLVTRRRDNVILQSASFSKLIERLTSERMSAAEFMNRFLVVYTCFATPELVLDALIARFRIEPAPTLSTMEREAYQKIKQFPIRHRVMNVLKRWIEGHPDDFAPGSAVREHLYTFLREDLPLLSSAYHDRSEALINMMEGDSRKRSHSVAQPPPTPIRPKKDFNPEGACALEIDHRELARQLTLLDSKLFEVIPKSEFLEQVLKVPTLGKPEPESPRDSPLCSSGIPANIEGNAPRLRALLEWSEKVSSWVMTQIIKGDTIKSRRDTLKHFVKMARELQALSNYQGLYNVIRGIQMPPVQKLRRTWEALSDKKHAILGRLTTLLSSAWNYRNLREAIGSRNPPAVPLVLVRIRDLQFLDRSFPGTFVQDLRTPSDPSETLEEEESKFIHFSRWMLVGEVIMELQHFQQQPYPLVVIPEIREYLLNVKTLSESAGAKFASHRFAQEMESEEKTTKATFRETSLRSFIGSFLGKKRAGTVEHEAAARMDHEWLEQVAKHPNSRQLIIDHLNKVLSNVAHPLGKPMIDFIGKFTEHYGMREGEVVHNVEGAVAMCNNDIHYFIETMFQTIMWRYRQLDNDVARDIVLGAINDCLFPSLYNTIFTLYKRNNAQRDRILSGRIQSIKSTPGTSVAHLVGRLSEVLLETDEPRLEEIRKLRQLCKLTTPMGKVQFLVPFLIAFTRDCLPSFSGDDLADVLFFVIIHANIPNMYAEISFMEDFMDADAKMREFGYFTTAIEVAMEAVLRHTAPLNASDAQIDIGNISLLRYKGLQGVEETC